MLKKIMSGFSAGILITIGGCVFLSCENKIAGAVLFSVALICICLKGYSLFTGKIGFIPERHGREEISILLWGLLGNALACALCGLAVRYALPSIAAAAEKSCASKLLQALPQTFIRALFCGVLMYLAVSIYKEKNTVVGIVFCIPVFILSGFEHSVADMFYFSAAGAFTLPALVFILVVILGNSVGGVLLPLISMQRSVEHESNR